MLMRCEQRRSLALFGIQFPFALLLSGILHPKTAGLLYILVNFDDSFVVCCRVLQVLDPIGETIPEDLQDIIDVYEMFKETVEKVVQGAVDAGENT